MKKFTLGMVAGASTLALAVPLLAQMAGAATGGNTSARADWTPPVPTQACVEAMSGLDGAHLAAMDVMTVAHKTALQARKNALDAAASLTDDTARQEAVQKAQENFRSAMETVRESDAMKVAMEALQESCGKAGMKFGMGGGMDMGMFGEEKVMRKAGRGMRMMHGGWLQSGQNASAGSN